MTANRPAKWGSDDYSHKSRNQNNVLPLLRLRMVVAKGENSRSNFAENTLGARSSERKKQDLHKGKTTTAARAGER